MARSVTSAAAVLLAALGVAACGGGAPLPAGPGMPSPADSGMQLPSDAGMESPAPILSETTAQSQCPPDLTLPIPARICPTAREDVGSKLLGQFPQDGSPVEVDLMIRGGANICALTADPACRTGPCPNLDITDYWAAENFASQKCVRDLIDSIGGTSTPERFWLIDTMVATLTWAQIQVVATHPHVQSIEPNIGAPPP